MKYPNRMDIEHYMRLCFITTSPRRSH